MTGDKDIAPKPVTPRPETADRDAPRRETTELSAQIAQKVNRMNRVRHSPDRSPLYGLGMFGLVGWAVAVPVVLGALLGLWIDAHAAPGRSWTLALLLAGAALGCMNAWYWINREGRDD